MMNAWFGHEASETQTHTHTCQKNGRRGCKFDYPKQPSPETRLKTNADGGSKARFYIIKREPGAEMVNPYN